MYQWMEQASAQRGRGAADGRRYARLVGNWRDLIGTLLVVWMPIIFNALHHA